MKELAAFIDLADGNEIEEKNQNSFWSSDSRLKLKRILCQ